VTVYPDWVEPVRLLTAWVGSATAEQVGLAEKLGLPVAGNAPRGVMVALLEDRLRPALHGMEPDAATERQRAFLRELGGEHHADPGLTKTVASAWIDYHLTLRTIGALQSLRPVCGNVVVRHHQVAFPDGSTESYDAEHVVSSVQDDGLIFFKGGNGQCAWPSNLTSLDARSAAVDLPD
jgi:hypothetical protein